MGFKINNFKTIQQLVWSDYENRFIYTPTVIVCKSKRALNSFLQYVENDLKSTSISFEKRTIIKRDEEYLKEYSFKWVNRCGNEVNSKTRYLIKNAQIWG